jgi:LacI family transcriptional regulator
VDGLIIMTAHLGEENYFDDLKREGLKFVLAYRGVGEHSVVRGDDYIGGQHVTRHLLSKGHRRIGVIAGPRYVPGAAQRVKGYRSALTESGLPVDAELIMESGRGIDDGEHVARQLLALPSPPTALFAVTDLLAIGAMAAIQQAGLRVGTDVAVVGYNDIPLAARLPVPLSSVHTPADDIGRLTVRGLLQVLEGNQPESVILPVQLHVRASSDPEARSRPRVRSRD